MNIFKACLHFALLCGALVATGQPASARTLEEIRKDGRVIVATEGQFAPFNFFKGANLEGFEIDLTNEAFKRMGLKVEWKAISFDALLTGLRQDRWDFVVASHEITEERKKVASFANPHYCSSGVVVTRSAEVKKTIDLTGRTVSVATGTTAYDWVKKNVAVKDLKNFPQDGDARAAVLTGRADAWVTDRVTAEFALHANPGSGLRILSEVLFQEHLAAVAAKGNTALLNEWNKALATMVADGSYAALMKKWSDVDLTCH